MVQEKLNTLSGEAAADLSTNQFHIVALNSSGQLAVAGAGLEADGVLQDKPDAQGKVGSYAIGGVTKIKAGAVLAAGAKFSSDATGRAILSILGDFVLGRTRTAAAAADEIIEAIWQPQDISV